MWKIIICGVICFVVGTGVGVLIMGFFNAADIDKDKKEEQ